MTTAVKKDPEVVTLRRTTGTLETRCAKLEAAVKDLQKQLKRLTRRLQDVERTTESRLQDVERLTLRR